MRGRVLDNTVINKIRVGHRLKAMRGKQSLRSVEAACGVDDAIIQRIEVGTYTFKSWYKHVEKLCKYYGIKIDEVIYENH